MGRGSVLLGTCTQGRPARLEEPANPGLKDRIPLGFHSWIGNRVTPARNPWGIFCNPFGILKWKCISFWFSVIFCGDSDSCVFVSIGGSFTFSPSSLWLRASVVKKSLRPLRSFVAGIPVQKNGDKKITAF